MSTLEVKGIQAPAGYNLAMPAGHIVQVQSSTYQPASTVTITSTSYVNTGVSQVITPKKAGNKILVRAVLNGRAFGDSGNDVDGYFQLVVGSTQLLERRFIGDNLGKLGDSIWLPYTNVLEYLYTTTSTSALTFTLNLKCSASNRKHDLTSEMPSQMTLMEVQA